MFHRSASVLAMTVLSATLVTLPNPSPASAAVAVAVAESGRDISFPQCDGPLPKVRNTRFAILGVNGGRAFTKNRCLTRQLRWAKRLAGPPAFYANTGNPGPKNSAHWPLGQTWPRECSRSEPNSVGCSYDYGWNAAKQSFSVATDAAQQLHGVSRENARQRVANVDWWLDVEILNSWQTLHTVPTRAKQQNDVATLAGAVNALWDLHVGRVGIYSTSYQWSAITGGILRTRGWFSSNPVWLAGFDHHADAVEGCGHRSFTGGPVLMTQYLAKDGFDGNVACA
jgi:hypothetical protein